MKVLECNQLHSSASKERESEPRRIRVADQRSYTVAGLSAQTSETCFLCESKGHLTKECNEDKLDIDQKKQRLKEKNRCFRCTVQGHTARYCKVRVFCQKCKKGHATTMCDPNFGKRPVSTKPTECQVQNDSTIKRTYLAKSEMHTHLQTAAALAVNPQSKQRALIRLLMDGGSETSFVREDLAKQLNLKVVGSRNIRIHVFGQATKSQARRCDKVYLVLINRKNGSAITISAIVVPEICIDTFGFPDFKNCRFKGYDMADIQASRKLDVEGISMLIGADFYWKIATGEIHRISENLVLMDTILGWTLHGPEGQFESESVARILFTRCEEVDISSLWKLDELGIKVNDDENEEYLAEFMDGAIERKEERYEVSLPWKEDKGEYLLDNYSNARARLITLLYKLTKNGRFNEYDDIIRGYIKDNIAEPVNENAPQNGPVYYMPHRAVYREDRDTTKVRIVFDASSCITGAASLNGSLCAGAQIVTDLIHILLRFRSYPVGLVADIEKAFTQISLAPKDRDCHRFLWIHKGKISKLRMTRVTFGVKSSPFLLTSTIKKHLRSFNNDTTKLIEQSMYVDDLVFGANSSSKAIRLVNDSVQIMKSAGMSLRKWHSNDQVVRRMISDYATDCKVLGIWWHLVSDELSVCLLSIKRFMGVKSTVTKRFVAQAVARIYDPLGLVTPYIIQMKILLQDLWIDNISWDEAIDRDREVKFERWISQLALIEQTRFPRLIITQNTELHIFCDASTRPYGAVAYLKAHNNCSLLLSRARVSPIDKEKLTLPRLELMAANLASRMRRFLSRALMPMEARIILWSHSKIVLHWIKGKPEKWKSFVANRVREIQTLTIDCIWKHCPGIDNPADLLTRGISAEELKQSSQWKLGPSWLRQNKFPKEEPPYLPEGHSEMVSNVLHLTCVPNVPIFDVQRFNSLTRIIMVTHNVFTFIKLLRKKHAARDEMGISKEEWFEALRYWIKDAQMKFYPEEVRLLLVGKSIPNTSRILKMNPFTDQYGIMRLKTRLQEAQLSEDERNPIIIPKQSHLAKLLIWDAHARLNHSGVNAVLTLLREQFWIIQGRQLIKGLLNRCCRCQRLYKREVSLPIAPLPRERTLITKAFDVVGLDFAGPLYIKSDEHQVKVYITLFTCATSRAVHLELVESMETEAFIRALRRFVARRGKPSLILSDNAKTFKRAAKELMLINHLDLKDELIRTSMKWKFNVELAPWWGGFWERLVRTVKNALKLTLQRKYLTFSELSTVLTEVEATINRRPLTYVSSETDDPKAITPAELIGGGVPLVQANVQGRTQALLIWKTRKMLLTAFWKRWSSEYLQQLRSIHQWNNKQNYNFVKEGDVVLLKDPNKKRMDWQLVRVSKVFVGRDKIPRSCGVQTATGSCLKRPVQLLVPLEITPQHRGPEDDENHTSSNCRRLEGVEQQ